MNEIQARLFPEYSGRMRRRNLREDMVTLHCNPKTHSITFNQYITDEVLKRGMQYACFVSDTVSFVKSGDDGEIRVTTTNNDTNIIISSVEATVWICKHFSLEDGDYYVGIQKLEETEDYITYKFTHIIDGQWYVTSPSKDDEQQGGDGAGNAACYTPSSILGVVPTTLPTLEVYTDEQLYNELRRRGYEGKLTKHTTLE
jgi:hypothetical protein